MLWKERFIPHYSANMVIRISQAKSAMVFYQHGVHISCFLISSNIQEYACLKICGAHIIHVLSLWRGWIKPYKTQLTIKIANQFRNATQNVLLQQWYNNSDGHQPHTIMAYQYNLVAYRINIKRDFYLDVYTILNRI